MPSGNFKPGQGFTQQPKASRQDDAFEAAPVQVAQSTAIARAETGIKGLERMTGRYEAVVTQAFDQLMDEADSRIADHIGARLGASHSFFDFNVDEAFQSLMPTPRGRMTSLAPSQTTIEVLPAAN
jgi:hypothetical protein